MQASHDAPRVPIIIVISSGDHVRELFGRASLGLRGQRPGFWARWLGFPTFLFEDVKVHVGVEGVRTEGHGCLHQRRRKYEGTRHGVKDPVQLGGVIKTIVVFHHVRCEGVHEVQTSESVAPLYAVHLLIDPNIMLLRPGFGFSHGSKRLDGLRSNVRVRA